MPDICLNIRQDTQYLDIYQTRSLDAEFSIRLDTGYKIKMEYLGIVRYLEHWSMVGCGLLTWSTGRWLEVGCLPGALVGGWRWAA